MFGTPFFHPAKSCEILRKLDSGTITAKSASHCVALRLTLKNNALESQSQKQGIYQPSSTVNGRPSWTSASAAIWYIPEYKVWAFGALDNIGTTGKGIKSEEVDELVDPQNVESWQYYTGSKWTLPADKNDIIVECINSE